MPEKKSPAQSLSRTPPVLADLDLKGGCRVSVMLTKFSKSFRE